MRLCATLLVLVAMVAQSQELTKSRLVSEKEEYVLRQLPNWAYTTKAYQQEALRLLLEEANSVAKILNLSEKLPINNSNVVEVYFRPPGLVALGSVSTSNYVYFASVGRTFSGLDQRRQVESFYEAKEKYQWPVSRLNTNAAYQTATQMMSAVGMDVNALNRDCKVDTRASFPDAPEKAFFLPVYRVSWLKDGKSVASFEFLEPTKTVRHISVFDPQYILRKPKEIPNLAELLQQTNTLTQTNAPPGK